MASTICPAVTVDEPHTYREQMEQFASFAIRLHIDLADGTLTPNRLIPLDQIWWPGGMRADLHVMDRQPANHTELLVSLGPQLVIIHAEAEGDFDTFAAELHGHGIEVGVALLPQTSVDVIATSLAAIDHVLIFSGDLGHYGGQADLSLLQKARQLRALKPTLEIGWDGGINDQNIRSLIDGGVDVLNVGGYIARAQEPAEAFASLQALADNTNHGQTDA